MIGPILDFLRRSTGQTDSHMNLLPSSKEVRDEEWKKKLDVLLAQSESKPRLLVEFVRDGIPNNLRGWAWCRILRISNVPEYLKEFDKEVERIFGTSTPIHFQTPCFGSPLDWLMATIPSERREIIKMLLCVVGDAHPHLEYAPLVPAIIAILSKKLAPKDVLACMASMIEGHSIPAYKKEDWAYFPLYRRDYLVFERVFEDLLERFCPKISKIIRQNQLVNPPWDKLLTILFIGILPKDVILRIFDCYLVEGYKIIIRFAIAHVLIRQQRLGKCINGEDLRKVLFEPVEAINGLCQLYVETAFKIKFDRSIIQKYRSRRRKHSLDDYDGGDQLLIFHRPLPQLCKPSRFLQDSDWAHIWSWIPPRFRLLNLELVFTSAEHGLFLPSLLSQAGQSEPLLLILETQSGKIIGMYISKSLRPDTGTSFYGNGETFLYTVRPNAIKYAWDSSSNDYSYILTSDSFIAFGMGDGFGLWIDRYLTKVNSEASVTFGNPPLLDVRCAEDLSIYCIELYRFV